MNVASLDLCKELYELSGWMDTELTHYKGIVSWASKTTLQRDAEENEELEPVPAYELGYLLRKLPAIVLTTRKPNHNETVVDYNFDKTLIRAIHNTPEDAACKLAIELFKQGVLTKEQKKG